MYFYAADVLSISSQKLSISYNTWSECISNNYLVPLLNSKYTVADVYK